MPNPFLDQITETRAKIETAGKDKITMEKDDKKLREDIESTTRTILEKIKKKDDLKKRIQKRENKITALTKEKEKKESFLEVFDGQIQDQQGEIYRNKQ